MQIIIPMTGYGSRFKAAGYKELKPFIKVHGKPILEWVVKMFPGEKDILFVCRQEHLDTIPNMEAEIKRICPTGKIASIGDDWEKLGPVYNIMQVKDFVKDDETCITCYCDYYMHWDYEDFKRTMKEKDCEGCVPCYTGFHPHLIPEKNLYASCQVDKDVNLIEIREKFSFEKDKTKALHSPGAYYFKSGALLKKYYQKQIDRKMTTKDEFYSSITYNLLCEDGLKTYIYDKIPHFCQWGTPKDLEDHLFWVEIVKSFK